MELSYRIMSTVMALVAITLILSITTCAINSDNNYTKTRTVCIENGGSVVTRWRENSTSGAVNCELPGSATEAPEAD